MMRVMIAGAGSYVGQNVRRYLLATSDHFEIDEVDTLDGNWRQADFGRYDVVFHVAGIAHVNAGRKLKELYYSVNRDLAIEVARAAKAAGVRQFIFMSSQIVYHESRSLRPEVLTAATKVNPNGFYGDSKLQAENGLRELECESFRVCILRPPLIYGPNANGNFLRLMRLAKKTPIFPAWHNKRSMLYVDNLAEFVKQAILRGLGGTYCPQNRELVDTVDVVRFFAKASGRRVWVTRLLNPFVWLGSLVLQPINKMLGTYYYAPEMSRMDFDYQLVGFEESLDRTIG